MNHYNRREVVEENLNLAKKLDNGHTEPYALSVWQWAHTFTEELDRFQIWSNIEEPETIRQERAQNKIHQNL